MMSRAASVIGGWATAVMTLLAGLPHFECRCPDGHVKPFWLGLASGVSSCCCGCSCCSSSTKPRCCCRPSGVLSSGHSEKGCCRCRHQVGQPAKPLPDDGWVAQHPGCVKTLVAWKWSALTAHKKFRLDDPSGVNNPPSASTLVHPGQSARHEWISWLVHSPAPPADLVTLLQRLLI